MRMQNDRFVVYDNAIKRSHARQAVKWQEMFVRKFGYDPDETYTLSLEDNRYLGPLFGVQDIVRGVLRDVAHFFHCAGDERRAKAGLRDFVVERDHAAIAQRSKPVLAVGGETQKLHALFPFLVADFAANNPSHDASHCVTLSFYPKAAL